MDGNPPLGYENKDKKLIINPSEATTVQLLYDLYLELGNVRLVCEAAKQQGLITKSRISASSKMQGGKWFSSDHLYHLLGNPIYVDKVKHKGEVYPGGQDGIIDPTLWQETQTWMQEM